MIDQPSADSSAREQSAFDRFAEAQLDAARADGGTLSLAPSHRWLAHWVSLTPAGRVPPRLRLSAEELPCPRVTGTAPYVPFATYERPQPGLEIRRADGVAHCLFYEHLGIC